MCFSPRFFVENIVELAVPYTNPASTCVLLHSSCFVDMCPLHPLPALVDFWKPWDAFKVVFFLMFVGCLYMDLSGPPYLLCGPILRLVLTPPCRILTHPFVSAY